MTSGKKFYLYVLFAIVFAVIFVSGFKSLKWKGSKGNGVEIHDFTADSSLNTKAYIGKLLFFEKSLGMTVHDASQNGKFRVPTLRNVAITPPYMHNGVFKTLFTVVAFYNTRDVMNWPAPEVPENINPEELGNLGLSNREIEDLVAFLKTLTDNWSATY